MTVVALGSVKASPGVTTAAVALAAVWPQGSPVMLVEADPDGGVMASRHGLQETPGMSTLAAEARHRMADGLLSAHLQRLPGGLPLLVGPADPGEATRTLSAVADRLAAVLAETDGDVLVDVGRLRSPGPAVALVAAADIVLVVARPRLDELRPLARRLPRVHRESGGHVGLLLVGERPYPSGEVARVLDAPVVGVLPEDTAAAEALNGMQGGARRLRRSLLLRTAREVADRLAGTDRSRAAVDAAIPSRWAARLSAASSDADGGPEAVA